MKKTNQYTESNWNKVYIYTGDEYISRIFNFPDCIIERLDTNTSVSKIIGYAHPIKFTKMFQKHFRVSPKKYQQFQKNLSLEKLRSQIIGPQKVSDMS